MLPNVGPWEMVVILLVVLLVFGAKRLPEVARGLGKGIREFKKEVSGLNQGINDAVNSASSDPPQRPMPVDGGQKNHAEPADTAQSDDQSDKSGPADPVIL